MLYSGRIQITNESLWHRFKRRLFARPILSFDADGAWVMAWYWRSGVVEIIKEGRGKPYEIIEVPRGAKVIHETH